MAEIPHFQSNPTNESTSIHTTTKTCPKFEKGVCTYGAGCKNKHNYKHMGKGGEMLDFLIGSVHIMSSDSSNLRDAVTRNERNLEALQASMTQLCGHNGVPGYDAAKVPKHRPKNLARRMRERSRSRGGSRPTSKL